MAVSEEEKQKLIKECCICDIDLQKGFMFEAMKVAKCGSQSKPVNYGRINQIVKQEKSKGGDAFFRTWKTICVLWKSYFGKKERKDAIEEQDQNGNKITKNQKFIVRPSYSTVGDFEKQTVNIYQKNHEDYNNLDKQLIGLEKQFRGSVEREKRKEIRKMQRLEEDVKAKGLKGTEVTDYIQGYKNRKQGFGWATSVEKVKSVMKDCLVELMEKCNGSDAKTYLSSQKTITKNYADKIMKTEGPEILRMSGRDYLNKLSNATNISKSAEILGGNEGDKNSKDLEILFNNIKTDGGQNLRDSLRTSVSLLS